MTTPFYVCCFHQTNISDKFFGKICFLYKVIIARWFRLFHEFLNLIFHLQDCFVFFMSFVSWLFKLLDFSLICVWNKLLFWIGFCNTDNAVIIDCSKVKLNWQIEFVLVRSLYCLLFSETSDNVWKSEIVCQPHNT